MNEKLFNILSQLSVNQLTGFKKLLDSPYFHQTQGVVELFQFVKKKHPVYPALKLSNAAIAQKLFPQNPNGEKKVKNYKVDLVKLLEEFLLQEQIKKEDAQRHFYLARAYQDLDLPKYAQSTMRKHDKKVNSSPIRDLSFHAYQTRVLHLKYFHPDTPKFLDNQALLQQLMDHLDDYYLLAKYKYAYEMLERTIKQKELFSIELWDEVVQLTNQKDSIKKLPIIHIYQQLFQLQKLDSINEQAFQKISAYYFSHLESLSAEDQQAIFKYLINYTIKANNKGFSHFKKIQFDLYQEGMKQNLLVWNQRITIATFYNTVTIAATCQAFDWIEEFISTHQQYLKQVDRNDTIVICQAFIFFHRGKPEAVLELLNTVHLKNSLLQYICIPLEVKSLFEIYINNKSYYTTILSRLTGLFRKLQQKYSLSDQNKKGYTKYIQLLRTLVNAHNNPNTTIKSLYKIKKEIESTKTLIQKDWLLKIVDQLIHP